MKLSNRISSLTNDGSDGWEVFYRAREMKAQGADIVELTIGEHDVRTAPAILDAMASAAHGGHTGYAMVPGVNALRDTVAARITERTGVPTLRENILITPGGQSALFSTHHAVCDEGDTALFIDPYYATYPGTINAVGAVPVAIPARAENAFQPKGADIAAVADGAKSLMINSPNNPTGVVYTRSTLEDIAATAIEKDLWVISDEVYDTQVWDGEHISIRTIPGMLERTLVVGSMSKSHAMTGSRVGWVAGPKEAVDMMIDLATSTTYGVPGYIQDAAHFALNQGPAVEQAVAAPFRRRRDMTRDLLRGQNIVKMIPADGAMYVMLDQRATGLTGEEFANRLLDTHGIAVMPGESFGRAAAGHLRVAMTIPDEAYAKALKTLLAFAAEVAA